MPKAEERALRKIAKQRHYGKKRTNRYVYGTLVNQGYHFHRHGKRKKK